MPHLKMDESITMNGQTAIRDRPPSKRRNKLESDKTEKKQNWSKRNFEKFL